MAHQVYTIGREFGSMGLVVGQKLAERLGIKYYDKELLQKAAKDSGFCEEIFENHDEKPTNSFLYSLVMDTYSAGSYAATPFLDMPLNHKVFLAQFDAIKALAEKESCVIVGRCADYILRDKENTLNVFLTSPLEVRAERIASRQGMSLEEAKAKALDKDKKRAEYYNYYTFGEWGAAGTYDLCIDSSLLGIEGTADFIIDFAKKAGKL